MKQRKTCRYCSKLDEMTTTEADGTAVRAPFCKEDMKGVSLCHSCPLFEREGKQND